MRIVYIISFFIMGISASPAAAIDRAMIAAFMQVTGFDKQLESLRMSADNAPLMLGLNATDYGPDWTILAEEVFEAEKIKSDAEDMLMQTLREEALLHGAELYASPLGVRIAEAENINAFADNDDMNVEGGLLVAKLQANGSKKIGYFHDMLESIGALENATVSFREVQVQFLLAAMNSGLMKRSIDEADLRAMLSAQDEKLQEAIIENYLNMNAYTYRDFTDDEIRQYRDALSTPQMQELYELMNGIIYALMIDRFKILARRMVDLKPNQTL